MRADAAIAKRGIVTGMDIPTVLQILGRAFLDALVARLGYMGAAAVMLLLAAELKTAAQREPPRASPGRPP
jgi:uncharacterized membrane protein